MAKKSKHDCLHLLLAIAVLICAHSLRGQSLQWGVAVGDQSDVFNETRVTDNVGNTYLTGFFYATTDFDPGPGVFLLTPTPPNSTYLLKLGPSGQFIWAVSLGSFSIYSTSYDSIGAHVYLSGVFFGSNDFDPGPSIHTLTSAGSSDIAVVKLDAAGNFIWAKQMGGTLADHAHASAVDPTGNVILSGMFQGTTDLDPSPAVLAYTSMGGNDVYVLKLSPSGNLIWAKAIGGPGTDVSYTVATDAMGNVFYTAVFEQTVDFDPGLGVASLTSAGSQDVAVAKLDANGNHLWAGGYGSSALDFCADMVIDASGNVLLAGTIRATADMDPGPGNFNLTPLASFNGYAMKWSATGQFSWATLYASTTFTNCLGLDVGGSGNVLVTGSFEGTADFDPGPGNYLLNTIGYRDAFISELDGAGNFRRAVQFGRDSAGAQGNSIHFVQADEFIAEGNFRDSIDLDPGPGSLVKRTGPMFYNAYLLKMRLCTPSYTSITASSCIAYTSPSGNHTWTASGVYMDTLLNHTGCDSITTFHITIHTPLGLLPPITGNAPVCEGSTNTYSVPANPNVSSYFWMLPGGWSGNSTTNSITAIAGGGSGTVSLQASNSCGSSNTVTLGVNVNPLPTPGFTSTTNQLAATFTNTSQFAFSWSWDFGDGNTSALQNPVHTYASPGTYNVCLTASDNSCSATICHMVTVVTVGNLEADHLGVSIFPNPSTGMFRLECKEHLMGKIYDAQGRILVGVNYESGVHAIDLAGMPDGVYTLLLRNEATSQSFKLLKMKR